MCSGMNGNEAEAEEFLILLLIGIEKRQDMMGKRREGDREVASGTHTSVKHMNNTASPRLH